MRGDLDRYTFGDSPVAADPVVWAVRQIAFERHAPVDAVD